MVCRIKVPSCSFPVVKFNYPAVWVCVLDQNGNIGLIMLGIMTNVKSRQRTSNNWVKTIISKHKWHVGLC